MPSTTTHLITEIEGIGDSFKEELNKVSVFVTEDLLALPANQMINKLKFIKGLASDKSEKLIASARFLLLENMTGQFAEGLVESGYTQYRELLMADTNTIVRQLEAHVNEGKIPETANTDMVQKWQIDAARRLGTSTLHLTVIDESTNSAIPDAEARINNPGFTDFTSPVKRQTTDTGLSFFEYLAPGIQKIVVSKENYSHKTTTFSCKSDGHVMLQVKLKQGVTKPFLIIDEFKDGVIYSISNTNMIVNEKIEDVSDLPSMPPFRVANLNDKRAVLSSLWFRKEDDIVYVPYVEISITELPQEISVNDVITINDENKFHIEKDVSPSQYRKEFLANRPFQNIRGFNHVNA